MNSISLFLIGIASSVLAASEMAEARRSDGERVIGLEEKAWFEQQSKASKKEILGDLRRAKACVANYAKKDGVTDGRAAAATSSRNRFYTDV